MNPQDLGARIRQAREILGLSQDDLAERVGRDQRSVSEYENGKRRIYAHDLPTFAEALDVPIVYFFEGHLSQSDQDGVLLDQFHRLTDIQERQTAIEIVRLFGDALLRK